jgi:hypothetical protein
MQNAPARKPMLIDVRICLPAAGTAAAFDFAEIGTIRWQLFVKATPVRLPGVGHRT